MDINSGLIANDQLSPVTKFQQGLAQLPSNTLMELKEWIEQHLLREPRPSRGAKLRRKKVSVLTAYEEKLLRFVLTSPRDKYAIIEHLYGLDISIEHTENRFNNLLFRLRRKYPNIIVFRNERYHVGEKPCLPLPVQRIMECRVS